MLGYFYISEVYYYMTIFAAFHRYHNTKLELVLPSDLQGGNRGRVEVVRT